MQGRFLLNVVIRQRASVFQLFSGKDQTLLIRRDALLVLDLGLDVVNRIRGFHVERDRLSRQSLDKNLRDGGIRSGNKEKYKVVRKRDGEHIVRRNLIAILSRREDGVIRSSLSFSW